MPPTELTRPTGQEQTGWPRTLPSRPDGNAGALKETREKPLGTEDSPPPPVPRLSCCVPTVVPVGGPVALPLEASAWRSAAPSTHQFASGAGPGFYKGTKPKHPPLGLGFAIFKKVPILSILTPPISMMIFVLPGLF